MFTAGEKAGDANDGRRAETSHVTSGEGLQGLCGQGCAVWVPSAVVPGSRHGCVSQPRGGSLHGKLRWGSQPRAWRPHGLAVCRHRGYLRPAHFPLVTGERGVCEPEESA